MRVRGRAFVSGGKAEFSVSEDIFNSPEWAREVLRDADILHFVKHGSVTNMIVRGDRDSVTAALRETDPLILDILPLTLEEVFTYEMEALGYKFEL